MGDQLTTGIGETGVAGLMKHGNGPIVMYRADMDCNAVKEITGLSMLHPMSNRKERTTLVFTLKQTAG